MTQIRRSRRLSAGAALAGAAALLAAPQPAALAASAVGHVSVTILPTAAGVGGGAMSFGNAAAPVRLALGPSGQTVGPAAYSLDGAHAAGSVTLTGLPGTPVTLSLSAGDLARGPGTPMPFRVVTASPSSLSAIDRSGALRLALDATLAVGPQQAPGAYRGSYTVTVDY